MFITLTIETNKKNRSPVHFKKRGFMQKLKSKFRGWKDKKYILDGQAVMF